MNADRILAAFHDQRVDYLLIGGMNFLLRHQPVLTFDVDFWVRDTPANLAKVNLALRELGACWGSTEETWKAVPADPSWLTRQIVFCLTTAHGAVDIFRAVEGLTDFEGSLTRSSSLLTEAGTPYRSLSDEDMLACQMALAEGERRLDRVAYLRKLLAK